MRSSRQGVTMGNKKAIQVDLGTLMHIAACSGIFRHVQEFRNIQAYSEFCVTPAYSEPWYIQN